MRNNRSMADRMFRLEGVVPDRDESAEPDGFIPALIWRDDSSGNVYIAAEDGKPDDSSGVTRGTRLLVLDPGEVTELAEILATLSR